MQTFSKSKSETYNVIPFFIISSKKQNKTSIKNHFYQSEIQFEIVFFS